MQRFWETLRQAHDEVDGVRVIVASRERLKQVNQIAALERGLGQESLTPLAQEDSDEMLRGLGVTDGAYQQAVFSHLAQGHPLITRMAAEAWHEAGGHLAAPPPCPT